MSCLDQKKQKIIKVRIVSQSKYSGRDHVQGKMRIWTRSVLGFAQYFRGSYPYACDEKQDGERSRGICSCSQENMTVSFSLTLCSLKKMKNENKIKKTETPFSTPERTTALTQPPPPKCEPNIDSDIYASVTILLLEKTSK